MAKHPVDEEKTVDGPSIVSERVRIVVRFGGKSVMCFGRRGKGSLLEREERESRESLIEPLLCCSRG